VLFKVHQTLFYFPSESSAEHLSAAATRAGQCLANNFGQDFYPKKQSKLSVSIY